MFVHINLIFNQSHAGHRLVHGYIKHFCSVYVVCVCLGVGVCACVGVYVYVRTCVSATEGINNYSCESHP